MGANFTTYCYDLYRSTFDKHGMKGKTIWIVGASSGIGEYLAYELVKSGAKCIILSARRVEKLQRVKRECEAIKTLSSSECAIILEPLDIMTFVRNPDCAESFMDALMDNELLSDIDIVVINAARTQTGSALQNTQPLLLHLQQLNVFAPIALSQAMCKYWIHKINDGKMKRKDKKLHQIAITSSFTALHGLPKRSAYGMSKAAISKYMQAMRLELFNDNIDINIVYPAHVALTEDSLQSLTKALDGKEVNRHKAREKKKWFDNDLGLERCASLYTTVLQYSIWESWIASFPELLFCYLALILKKPLLKMLFLNKKHSE
eukprot:182815_1